MHSITAQPATSSTCSLAEGPVWDHRTHQLLWVDIHRGTLHRGELVGDRVHVVDSLTVDETVGAVALHEDGSLLVAGARAVLRVQGTRVETLVELVPDGQRRRLNDGKCDPDGRLLVGTLSLGADGPERLVRVEHDRAVTLVDDDLAMSNGLGWAPDGRTLYSVDTGAQQVWQRRYDVRTGTWGERRPFARVSDGSPDGLCVDAEGCVWLAVWGTGQVRCFDPDGTQVAVVEVDAPYVSCPTFAGPDLDRLVITTAIDDLDEETLRRHPRSGALFTADVGVAGLPSTPARVA